jgi:uncharacterized protein (TIGR02466 family)
MSDQPAPPPFGVDAGQIKINKLFATPVASLQHPDFERLNAELRATILARETAHPSTDHSNEGGWQSTDDFSQWSGAAGAELLGFAQELANQLSAVNSPEHGLIEAKLTWTCAAWANINRSGHGNGVHGHPGAYWSAVYWVDDGGRGEDASLGGELEFVDPRGVMPTMLYPALRMRIEGCLTAGFMSKMAPTAGTMVMFPSWLLHSVKPHRGDRARISIAFNFGL